MMRANMMDVVRRAAGVIGLALVAVLPLPGCKERTQRPLPSSTVERSWVPLSGMPLRGPATAKVTLVVFCDFQSPYCVRATERLRDVQREYKDSVRIQYRYRPLTTLYPLAQLAAEASAAAGEQGRFWRFHDLLFSRQDATPDRATLEKYAQELGLDLTRFRDALDSERARLMVDADSILAANLGVRGAPVVFVNGRPLRGLTELAKLETVIEEEIAGAEALLASGVDPRELYQKVAQAPAASESAPQPPAALAGPRPRGLDPKAVYKVPVDEAAPSKGPKDARVTIVLWSDFECGVKCSQLEPTLDALLAAHPRDVRLVWKFRPVPDHPASLLASEAALAAAREGKFWQFHDRLFAEPGQEREKLEEHAGKLGLDMARFRQALEERTYAEQILADVELSERLYIANLPQLFINGRIQPRDQVSREALEARVKEELEKANALLKQGVPAQGLYEAFIANGLDGIPEPGLAELPPLPQGRYTVDEGGSPVRGPKDAPVTIVLFSDFQCPYCARMERTLSRLGERYGDKLRIVWKDAPNLEFHKQALVAHQAGRAAAEQGRFWEMHDRIFRRPYLLDRSVLERYAQELGLDMTRFRAALDSGKYEQAIREEIVYGISLAGPSGTPTVFINGRLIPGAYPYGVFQQIIDEELARTAPSTPGTPSASNTL